MQVLDLSGPGLHSRGTGFGQVQVSTFCVEHGLLAVGGFVGELIVADTRTGALLHRCACMDIQVTQSGAISLPCAGYTATERLQRRRGLPLSHSTDLPAAWGEHEVPDVADGC